MYNININEVLNKMNFLQKDYCHFVHKLKKTWDPMKMAPIRKISYR